MAHGNPAFGGPPPVLPEEEPTSFGVGQNTPSPNGAASQGALGTPSSDGVSSGKELLFGGGTPEAVDNYYGMWSKGTKADQRYVADSMDKQLAPMGTSVMVKAGEMIKESMQSGDEEAMAVASDFGWSPSDPAFVESPEGQKKKSKWNRESMAGFLTEMGLRILASNRQDLGGALGEAGMGMIADKKAGAATARENKRQDAADKMKADEASRSKERHEQTTKIAGNKETRDQAIFEADKKAGRLGKDEVQNNYTVQRDDWMKWKLPDDPTKAQKVKAYEDFIDFFKNATRVTPTQREAMIDKYIKRRDNAKRSVAGTKEWLLLDETEKRASAMEFMDMAQEYSSFSDSFGDSGKTLDYLADSTF